jgi:hypothetical protein
LELSEYSRIFALTPMFLDQILTFDTILFLHTTLSVAATSMALAKPGIFDSSHDFLLHIFQSKLNMLVSAKFIWFIHSFIHSKMQHIFI